MPEPRQLQKLTRDDVTKHNKDGDLVRIISLFQLSFNPNFTPLVQWVIIDSKVYDLTRFKNLHPGGAAVLLDDDIGSLSHRSLFTVHFPPLTSIDSAGQDATDAFYGLHRHEVLERPQYQRLQVGYIDGETPSLKGRGGSGISRVPYAEPTWLAEAYHSPYYKEVWIVWPFSQPS
jgi:Cytochrome b5-like Heme/Steroid binding domain